MSTAVPPPTAAAVAGKGCKLVGHDVTPVNANCDVRQIIKIKKERLNSAGSLMKRLVRGVRRRKPRGELYIYSSWRASHTKEPNIIFLLPRSVILGGFPKTGLALSPLVLQDGNLQLLSVRVYTIILCMCSVFVWGSSVDLYAVAFTNCSCPGACHSPQKRPLLYYYYTTYTRLLLL
jgi:hypothetical protein